MFRALMYEDVSSRYLIASGPKSKAFESASVNALFGGQKVYFFVYSTGGQSSSVRKILKRGGGQELQKI